MLAAAVTSAPSVVAYCTEPSAAALEWSPPQKADCARTLLAMIWAAAVPGLLGHAMASFCRM